MKKLNKVLIHSLCGGSTIAPAAAALGTAASPQPPTQESKQIHRKK